MKCYKYWKGRLYISPYPVAELKMTITVNMKCVTSLHETYYLMSGFAVFLCVLGLISFTLRTENLN